MPAEVPRVVEINTVLSDPGAFQGRFISVVGYYCSGFEISGLFSDPNCEATPDVGLWLSGVSPLYQAPGHKVTVVGRYDGSERGHMAQWAGGVCVSRITAVEE